MTKENILNKHVNISLYTNDKRLNVWIGLAMEDYAREVALDFGNFLMDKILELSKTGVPLSSYMKDGNVWELYLQSKQQ